MSITVRATKAGYYGERRRRVGDEFEVSTTRQLGSWMERVPDPKESAAKAKDDGKPDGSGKPDKPDPKESAAAS